MSPRCAAAECIHPAVMPDGQPIDERCVFCQIVNGQSPATVLRRWPDAIAIRPRRPVTPGHTLVIPHAHVSDVAANPDVSAVAMFAAAELAGEHPAVNIITSRGPAATQTVYHLHLHVVPRTAGDGLPLPWTAQQREISMSIDQTQTDPTLRYRYTTIGGAVVTVHEVVTVHHTIPDDDRWHYTCHGCDATRNQYADLDKDGWSARRWVCDMANKHAAECRAMPKPAGEQSA